MRHLTYRKGAATLSCYTRHIADVREQAGFEDTKVGRKAFDLAIRKALRVQAGCPGAWKALKVVLADPKKKERLVERLTKAGKRA